MINGIKNNSSMLFEVAGEISVVAKSSIINRFIPHDTTY